MVKRTGQLDSRVKFEREITIRDSVGGIASVEWAELFSVWSSVDFISDAEGYAAGETSATTTARFTVRISTQIKSITPKDRIIFDSDEFYISGSKPTKDGRNRFVEFTASARSDDGEG